MAGKKADKPDSSPNGLIQTAKDQGLDVWETIKFVWTHTDITDRELIAILKESDLKGVPKSIGTISKRRSKEEWARVSLAEPAKETETGKQEAKIPAKAKKRKQDDLSLDLFRPKDNKVQKQETGAETETPEPIEPIDFNLNNFLENLTDDVALNIEQRAGIIVKSRRRISAIGKVQDGALAAALQLMQEHAQAVPNQKKIKELKTVANLLSGLSYNMMLTAKMGIEVELPLSGIKPIDLEPSLTDARTGALEDMDGEAEKEKDDRDEKRSALLERVKFMETAELEGGYFDDDQRDYNDDDDELIDVDGYEGEAETVDFTDVPDDDE